VTHDVVVVGLGYIGLPTASMLATHGYSVFGLEVNTAVVDVINRGEIHFVEPGLEDLVREAVGSGCLRAGTESVQANTYIIAVPTPLVQPDGAPMPDLTCVETAARSIAPTLRDNSLVILESTSPIGTTERVKAWVDNERGARGLDPIDAVCYAYCPERILPGQMIRELVANNRVCGGLTSEAAMRAELLYRSFCTGEIHLTDARTAEAVKLAENSSRDCQIAFANELDLICQHCDIDVWSVIDLANRHPRVNILQPGPGVGGHCIAVDPWFLAASAPELSPLIRTARQVNDSKPQWVVDQVVKHAGGMSHPRIACLGLAFKANVDDLRESPSLQIAETLAKRTDVELIIAEPHIDELPSSLQRQNVSLEAANVAVEGADIVLLLVDHDAFQHLNLTHKDHRPLVDTRGMWTNSQVVATTI